MIVQSDVFNRTDLNTVLAVAITTNVCLNGMPGNVELSRATSRLPKQSIVNVTQLITINKSWLKSKVRQLPQDKVAAIDAGLRLVLALR